MEKSTINWGIMGLGKIARTFAGDLQLSKDAVLHGVASRNIKKAVAFGQEYKTVNCYGSYEELARDADIDIVYIATPHPFHFENTMLCMKHGKAVLCEKPMGMNANEVEIMIKEAARQNLFLMEGLWTRFIPATEKLLSLIRDKIIGELLFIRADFGFRSKYDTNSRLYNKSLGGGSLLDIGIYPIYLSLLTSGIPVEIKAMARMAQTGIDSSCFMLFNHGNSAKALLESTIEADTPIEAYLYGSKGHLKLHSRFHHSQKISVYQKGTVKQEYEIPYRGNGYFHEIEEVNSCLINHKRESDKLPHQMSLDLIRVMDRVRKKIGMNYEDEIENI